MFMEGHFVSSFAPVVPSCATAKILSDTDNKKVRAKLWTNKPLSYCNVPFRLLFALSSVYCISISGSYLSENGKGKLLLGKVL